MPTVIVPERPDSADAAALIDELEAVLSPLYEAKSRHGYSVEKLLRERVEFFVMRRDGEPVGCGGIQVFGREFGEVKRMYVRPACRGLGLGRMMLEHLAGIAREHGVPLLRLETGIHQHAAIALYERYGFKRIPPFPPYKYDPVSLCFEMALVR